MNLQGNTATRLNVEAEKGIFSGYAAVFERVDQGRDIISQGAFSRSLRERGVQAVKLLWQHDPKMPIGCIEMLREDNSGLFMRGRLSLESVKGRDAYALIRMGALDGLSIGYRVRQAEADKMRSIRRLIDIDLWEVSVVTFPMQSAARVRAVKSGSLA
ncbi:MAG: HK97 family phage prohead protease [Sphingomonadales bacterium]